ncbi:MAG: hypothetical protein LQ338_001670 [Usnochroma carphineum]|nr:MAG: hypothetical protein LQ338_001670 [Usnochroma carphineum]
MSADSHSDAELDDRDIEEARSLLPNASSNAQTTTTIGSVSPTKKPLPERRQSSLSLAPPDGAPRTPRTTNRVRFEVEERDNSGNAANGRIADLAWQVEEEDYDASADQRRSLSQRAPLLTGIEAPSVTVASTDLNFNAEDLLESSRPKSGIKNAFMNMANSIIGAGIIGQPYAFRQAGLTMGIILLVALTITVDWTIRLIVINSKLSGANSFQATVEHCFGKSGLIAISVAQWAL